MVMDQDLDTDAVHIDTIIINTIYNLNETINFYVTVYSDWSCCVEALLHFLWLEVLQLAE